jgi:mono/diheme cytochrome c family protein
MNLRLALAITAVLGFACLPAAAGGAGERAATRGAGQLVDRHARDTVLGRMVVAPADAPSIAVASSPRTRYLLACSGCHGIDGSGSAPGNVPDLRRLGNFLRLDGGREYVLKVPGLMGSGLDDAQVAAVTNWVLANLARDSMPQGQPPYDAGEVARARAAPLTDVAAERRRLLAQARVAGISLY